jgi:GNAT superfamily N-acetyltransferase
VSVTYSIEPDLDPAEFTNVLVRSTLSERRPVGEAERIATMVGNADLIVCARDAGGRLIGVARSLTDFSYCCYLSDLAVDKAHQGRGIGRELIHRTHGAAGPGTTLLLLSAPAGMGFYPKAGLEKFDTCFGIRRAQ